MMIGRKIMKKCRGYLQQGGGRRQLVDYTRCFSEDAILLPDLSDISMMLDNAD